MWLHFILIFGVYLNLFSLSACNFIGFVLPTLLLPFLLGSIHCIFGLTSWKIIKIGKYPLYYITIIVVYSFFYLSVFWIKPPALARELNALDRYPEAKLTRVAHSGLPRREWIFLGGVGVRAPYVTGDFDVSGAELTAVYEHVREELLRNDWKLRYDTILRGGETGKDVCYKIIAEKPAGRDRLMIAHVKIGSCYETKDVSEDMYIKFSYEKIFPRGKDRR